MPVQLATVKTNIGFSDISHPSSTSNFLCQSCGCYSKALSNGSSFEGAI